MKISKIIFALLIISNIIGVTFVAKNRYEELLKNEQEILQSHAERLQRVIEAEVMVTEILEEVIKINKGTIEEDEFYRVSKILSRSLVSSSIAYIPDGVIKYLYPPEFSEGVVGRDVFTSPNDAKDSKIARDSNQVVISGPYELFENTMGIVVRNPVYYEGDFWGIVTVAIDAEALYQYVGLDLLERQGYEFTLETPSQLAARSNTYASDEAISEGIILGTSYWVLSLYAKDKKNLVASDVMFWFLIFLFINFILYYFLERLEKTKEKLIRRLENDSLTGAYNRYKLQKYYEASKDTPFALFFIDLNKFKPVNDNYGHKIGDKLLKAYVARLQKEMMANTFIARIGGDEFVVITPQVVDMSVAETIKRKLVHLSEQDFPIDKHIIQISASIGIVLSNETEDLEKLLTIADEKMYAEKGNKAR